MRHLWPNRLGVVTVVRLLQHYVLTRTDPPTLAPDAESCLPGASGENLCSVCPVLGAQLWSRLLCSDALRSGEIWRLICFSQIKKCSNNVANKLLKFLWEKVILLPIYLFYTLFHSRVQLIYCIICNRTCLLILNCFFFACSVDTALKIEICDIH